MTNEERDLIARFISRVAGSPQGGGFLGGAGGSVPQSQPALPPLDRDADAFIAQQFQQYPEARYRITQTALVQEAAFAEAQNRIRRLEWELQQTQQAMQQSAQQAPQQQKGFFGSLFGGGGQPQPQRGYGQSGYGQPGGFGQQFQPTSQPPAPQYPPNYQPGMFQARGGSGFLGSALTTAAGVAGGMVVGNALMGAFSGHGGGEGGFGNNASSTTAFDGTGTDPTAGFSTDANNASPDPFAGGGEPKSYDDGSGFGGDGFSKQTSYDQGGDPGGFDQGGADPFSGGGGGFDSGGFDDNA